MIFANDFVVLHLPKTGGTFVRTMMERLAAEAPDLGIDPGLSLRHAGVKRIPPEHRGKPIVTAVRHPLDHHVSRYHFAGWKNRMMEDGRMAKIKARYPHFPDVSFSEFLELRGDYDLVLSHKRCESAFGRVLIGKEIGFSTFRLVTFLDPSRGNSSSREIFESFDEMSEAELAARFSHVTFIFTEDLNRGLHDFLLERDVAPERIAFILNHQKVYPTDRPKKWRKKLKAAIQKPPVRKPWQDYFTAAEMERMAHLERLYFRLFVRKYSPEKTISKDGLFRPGGHDCSQVVD